MRQVGWLMRRSSLGLAGFVLCGLMLGKSHGAMGASVTRLSFAEQGVAAEVLVEATVLEAHAIVLDDGFPITEYDIVYTRTLVGADSTPDGERLRLPGGEVDGVLVDAGAPALAVGQVVLLAARRGRDGVLGLLEGNQSLFLASSGDGGDVATDADGNPVVSLGCADGYVIARPADEEPAGDGVTFVRGDRVFLDRPAELGLGWSEFVDQAASCVASVRSDGGER